MPLTFTNQISQNISIAVWHIVENEDYFYNFLSLFPNDEKKIKNIKLQKMRLQKLACRAALAKLLGNNKISITYSESGQPQLKDHYISFSHTNNAVAVAVATIPVGIDMEEFTPRILPLYTRFMSNKEIDECDVNNLKDLYYYWCAKEAMYKWVATKKLDFIKDLEVVKSENKGIVSKKQFLQLKEYLFENHIVVVCF